MPNLASMLLEGLQRAQLPGPQQQQQQPESLQSKSFSFPGSPAGKPWGLAGASRGLLRPPHPPPPRWRSWPLLRRLRTALSVPGLTCFGD